MKKILPPIVIGILLLAIFAIIPQISLAVIDIRKGTVKKTSVAIPEMTVNGKLASTPTSGSLTEALRFDLDNSGWFTTIKDYGLLSKIIRNDPVSGSSKLDARQLREWRATDAELLVRTDLSVQGKNYTIRCWVYDLITGNVVFSKEFTVETSNPRYLAHYISDSIVEKQTNRKGIARTKIAFVANKGTRDKHLYIMDYDGHNASKISNIPNVKGNMIVVAPDWGPTGREVYFTSYHDGYPYAYKIDLERSMLTKVSTFPGLNASLAISPNGSEMVICLSKTGSVEIHKKTINSQTTKKLTSTYGGVAAVPRWSPDGGRIAYVSGELGVPQIFVVDSNGGNKRRLIKGYSHTTSLDWSPKDDLIAFSATRNGRVQLFVADIKRNEVKQLTFDGANNSHPSFAPDGIHIIYTKESDYSSNLHMIDVRDLKDVRITDWKGNETYPNWSPVSFNR